MVSVDRQDCRGPLERIPVQTLSEVRNTRCTTTIYEGIWSHENKIKDEDEGKKKKPQKKGKIEDWRTHSAMSTPTTPVCIPNTAQRIIDTQCGPLQIMVSWPLGWTEDGRPPAGEQMSDVPVM